MLERLAAAAVVLAAAATMTMHERPARACAVCNCGDPTLTAVGVEQPYRNRVRAGVEERYGSHTQGDGANGEDLQLVRAGVEERYGSHTQGDGANGEDLQLVRSALFASWTPHARISVGLVVPWMTTVLTPSTGPTSLINGLGDMELSGRVLLARDKSFGAHHLLWATAGLKMPTAPRLHDDAGFPYADDDQPGSGSWDPFFGATYAWYSGALWSAYASGSYRYTTEGWHGYRRGQQVGWNAAVQAQPWNWGAFQLVVDGNWLAQDRLPTGAGMPNTGGTVMRIGPAFVFSARVDLMVRVAASVPVVQAFIGVQHDGPQVLASLVWDIR